MNIKKTKFSYFAWGLFLIIAFASILLSSFKALDLINLEADVVVIAIAVIVFLLAGVLVWLGGKAIVNALKDKLEITAPLSIMGESLVLFFVFVISFMIRFLYVTYADTSLITDTFCLNMAQKEDLSASFGSISPFAYIYLHLLHGSVSLFGAKPEAGLYLNILLQMLILFCFYFSLRILVGKKTAIFGGALYMALPSVLTEILSVSPELFWCFLQSVSIFLIILCGKFFVKNKMNAKLMLVASCATGILLGFGVYCDVSAVFLWISALIFWTISKNADEHGSVPFVLRLFVPSIGVLLGFLLGAFWASSKLNIGIVDCIIDYVKPFMDFQLNFSAVSPDFSNWYALVYMIFGIVFLLRYLKWPKDYASALIFYLFGVVLVSFLGVSALSYQSICNYLWLFVVTFGVISLGTYEIAPVENNKEIAPAPSLELNTKKADEKTQKTVSSNSPAQKSEGDDSSSLEFLSKKESKTPQVVKNVNEQQIPLPVRSVSHQVQQMAAHNIDEAKQEDAHIGVVNENIQNLSKENENTVATQQVHTNVHNNETTERVSNMHINNGIPVSVPLSGEGNKRNAIVTGSNEVTLSYTPTDNTPKETQTLNENVSAEKTVSKANEAPQNDASVSEGEGAAAKESSQTPPTEQPKPVMRYGRRMDYKTAVVSSPRRNIESKQSSNDTSTTAVGNQENKPVAQTEEKKNIPVNPASAPKSTGIPKPASAETKANENTSAVASTTTTHSSAPSSSSSNLASSPKTTVPLPVPKPQNNKLHNPLPTPKKHEARDLDYDYQFANSQMHFDLVDMSGKDYFDIN